VKEAPLGTSMTVSAFIDHAWSGITVQKQHTNHHQPNGFNLLKPLKTG
jgi:hypothetical protein